MFLIDLEKETFRVAVTERQPAALMDAWSITLEMDAAVSDLSYDFAASMWSHAQALAPSILQCQSSK